MGEVEEDDFGELYADAQFNSSSSSVIIPTSKDLLDIQEDDDEGDEPVLPPLDIHSISNENDSKPLEVEVFKGEPATAAAEEFISENESDSEDDLRIVLNDEDCRGLNPIVSNGGRRGIHQEEDEDLQSQQLLNLNGVENISPPAVSEKGFGVKTNYYLQSSQYKYIRSHGAALPFNAKRNGFASAASFSLSSTRCDWDANGFNQQPGSSTRTASSGSIPFLLTGQTGFDFSLPRRRTIFDVNIDAFEQKPWKHTGVDIADYFNFGLDEESWKHYCNNLEQFRRETTGVSRSNQAYEARFGGQGEAPEAPGEEAARIGQVGGVSAILKDFRGERMLDKPKGRAIQVDGGIGERRPSMDTRRCRNRDSDVVIKISVEDDMECSSNSSEELGQSCNSKLILSDTGGSSMDATENAFSAESDDEHEADVKDGGMWSWKRCSKPKIPSSASIVNADAQGIEENADVDGCHRKAHVCEGTSKAIKTIEDFKEDTQRNPIREDPCTPEAESSLGNHNQYTSSLSCSNSHNEPSSVRVGSFKKRTHKPARRQFSNSISGLFAPVTLECNRSNYSRRNHCKIELRDNKDEQDSCSRLRLQSVAETATHVGDDVAPRMFSRRDWHDENHLTKRSRRRDRQFENDYDDGKDLPYYGETEISVGYRRERFAGNPVKDASVNCFHGKGHTEFRSHWDEKDYILENKYSLEENESRQREHFLPGRQYSNRKFYGVTHDDSHGFKPESFSFYTEKERYRWQRRKRIDEESFRRGTEGYNFVLERRYREQYTQENCASPVQYYDREREYVNEGYDRNVSYKSPNRRDRLGGSPCRAILTDLYRDVVHDDDYRRHFDHETLSPHRDFGITLKRGWRNAISLRPADSRRLEGGDSDHWRQTHSGKHQNSGCYDHIYMDNHDADSIFDPVESFPNEGRGYTHQSNASDWPEDRISFRHQNQGVCAEEASFLYERNSKHKSIHIKKNVSGKGLDENWLLHDRKRNINDEPRDSAVNARINSSFNLVDKVKDEEADLKKRKSLDLHYVDGEGKASGKWSKTGNARFKGRKSAGESIDKEHKPLTHSNRLHSGKVTPSDNSKVENNCLFAINSKNGKYPKTHLCKKSALEEGQLAQVEDEKKEVNPPKTKWQLEKTQSVHLHANVNQNKIVEGYENHRILETIAKMEKRRERFKEPIAPKEPDHNSKPQPDIVVEVEVEVEAIEAKQERPKRKRRWGGNGL